MTANLEGGDDVEEEKRFEEHVCSLFWIRASPRGKRTWTPFYASSALLCAIQLSSRRAVFGNCAAIELLRLRAHFRQLNTRGRVLRPAFSSRTTCSEAKKFKVLIG